MSREECVFFKKALDERRRFVYNVEDWALQKAEENAFFMTDSSQLPNDRQGEEGPYEGEKDNEAQVALGRPQ
jgi:hypothetical protein